jgi:hypothetical protein
MVVIIPDYAADQLAKVNVKMIITLNGLPINTSY